MYALVDVNNMYVSCERVFRPALLGRPVVVLSNNDGCAIARSNEAKDLGVQMAQPWFQIRHLARKAGLIALSANFELYGDMSSRMMTLAARYAPRQEIYSIDECFLDFAGVRGDLVGTGRELRATVLQWTGLPTSVGFGPAPNQQIMCSRTFGASVTELSELVEVVSQFAARVAEKARHQHSIAGAVHVFITTSPFRRGDRQHSPSATLPLVRPTADTRLLNGAAVHALERMYRPGFNYAKAGVMLVDLRPEGLVQSELDLRSGVARETAPPHDRPHLMSALDAVNQRFGRGAVGIASAAQSRGARGYIAKQDLRSPRYTTRIEEIPTVAA